MTQYRKIFISFPHFYTKYKIQTVSSFTHKLLKRALRNQINQFFFYVYLKEVKVCFKNKNINLFFQTHKEEYIWSPLKKMYVFNHLHVETNISLTKENILIAVFYEL